MDKRPTLVLLTALLLAPLSLHPRGAGRGRRPAPGRGGHHAQGPPGEERGDGDRHRDAAWPAVARDGRGARSGSARDPLPRDRQVRAPLHQRRRSLQSVSEDAWGPEPRWAARGDLPNLVVPASGKSTSRPSPLDSRSSSRLRRGPRRGRDGRRRPREGRRPHVPAVGGLRRPHRLRGPVPLNLGAAVVRAGRGVRRSVSGRRLAPAGSRGGDGCGSSIATRSRGG